MARAIRYERRLKGEEFLALSPSSSPLQRLGFGLSNWSICLSLCSFVFLGLNHLGQSPTTNWRLDTLASRTCLGRKVKLSPRVMNPMAIIAKNVSSFLGGIAGSRLNLSKAVMFSLPANS